MSALLSGIFGRWKFNDDGSALTADQISVAGNVLSYEVTSITTTTVQTITLLPCIALRLRFFSKPGNASPTLNPVLAYVINSPTPLIDINIPDMRLLLPADGEVFHTFSNAVPAKTITMLGIGDVTEFTNLQVSLQVKEL